MNPQKESARGAVNTYGPDIERGEPRFNASAAGLTTRFRRELLPDPLAYYESQGLRLIGPRNSLWKTAACRFHGGSDSLRINTQTGAFVCMAGCGARGGDVLSYHMAVQGLGFIDAAEQLGAWVSGDTRPQRHIRPTPLPARDALTVLAEESTLIAIEGSRIANGVSPTAADLDRVRVAAGRISHIKRMFE